MAKPSIYLIEASTHTRRALLEEIGAKEPEWRVFAFPLVTKALREWETAEPALVLVDADGVFTREEIMELANKSASGPSGGIHLLSSCENGPPEALKQLALGWIPKPPAGAALPAGWSSTHLRCLLARRCDGAAVGNRELPARVYSPPLTPLVLAIGVSTGGPAALEKVLPELPAKFPAPVLIAQHIPEGFSGNLARALSSRCKLPVREGIAGEPLLPGGVWLAPGDRHMEVEGPPQKARLRLHQEPPENFCRPAVDPLFRSVARVYGSRVLALVLTGMGQDGLEGARSVRGAGGLVWAQDESTSVVWGMPGAVVKGGIAHGVYPLGRLGSELCRVFSCI